MIDLKGKNCFITGATGGLGKEIALELALKGCNLFLTATNDNKLADLCRSVSKESEQNISIFYKSADLNNLDDIKNVVLCAKEKMKQVDILINCAGIFVIKDISDLEIEDYNNSFNINVRAPFILCKEFGKDMKDNGWGRIVNIGSSSAYDGFRGTSLYCSSKHALRGLSRSLYEEFRKSNVRVLFISPSSMDTEMGRLAIDQDFRTFIDPKEAAKYISFVILFNDNMVVEDVQLKRLFL